MTELERALNISFNDQYNSLINNTINTNESSNVARIFQNINIYTECIICYDENVPCLKCCQCTANYCKTCLTKIASDSNKCICGIDIKNNYNKMHSINVQLLQKIELDKLLNESLSYMDININRNTNRNTNKNTNYNSNKNTNINTNYNSNKNTNINTNYNSNKNNNININNKKTNILNNNIEFNSITNSSITNSPNIINDKKDYLSYMNNNHVYNIDFKSYVDDNIPNKPNFKYEWNMYNKTLIFSPFINKNNNTDLINININYTILDDRFQAELYVWLLDLLNYKKYIFKTKWNLIAYKINNINYNSNQKQLMTEIIKICTSYN